jgi:hypothetical protein
MPSRQTLSSPRACPTCTSAGLFIALAAVLLVPAPAPAASGPVTIVVCAPGYPGSTAEAQAAMTAFAAATASAAGWQPEELSAVYFETEQGGLDRLAEPDAALALVPLPFFLQHRAELSLEPRLQAVQQGGAAAEPWTLVAAAGVVKGPESLAGFELVSLAGYVPRFVRGPALGAWGVLPPTVTITFSSAVLSGLRRAAAGGKVALLLDRAQAAALPTLPFADKLEVVTRSAPLPVSVLAVVRGRLPAARLEPLQKALRDLGGTPIGAEALAGIRLTGFVPAEEQALARAREAFDRVKN